MVSVILITVSIFVGLLVTLEIGRWMRARSSVDEADRTGAADGMVFAIVGLLIAFSFSGAAARFDERRELIVKQSNALGTAWLRTELLPPADRDSVRRPMREWLKLTLEGLSGDNLTPELFEILLAKAAALQDQSWLAAVSSVDRHPRPHYAQLVLPPINEWIDLTTERVELNNRGAPPIIFPMLVLLALTCAVLAGFKMGKQSGANKFHRIAFATVITFSLYVVMDMNQPRSGLIQITGVDGAMKRLYQSMLESERVVSTQPDTRQ